MTGKVTLNDLLKDIERLGANQRLPVDGKGRRALHTDLPGDLGHLLDGLGVFAGVHAFVEGGGVQLKLDGKGFQIVLVEGALVLAVLVTEQVVVVFPELFLVGGAFAGFSSPERFFAEKCVMEITQADFPVCYVY